MSAIVSLLARVRAVAYCTTAGSLMVLSSIAAADPQQQPDAASLICATLSKSASAAGDVVDRDAVKGFYAGRNCRPVWVDEQGPTRAAARAIDEIGHAGEWGLSDSDLQLPAYNTPRQNGHWTPAETAAAELEITRALLRYAHQAQGGRIPTPDKQLSSYLDRQPQVAGATDVLARLTIDADPGATLRSYQPSQDQFLKLKALLATLRGAKAAAPTTVTIAVTGPTLMSESKGPEIALLKKRLNVASKPGEEEVFDDTLEAAVRAFQKSQSLHRDGIVGPLTRAALNGGVPVATTGKAQKIAAVIANMEEWRWMPADLGARHILVNIPSFSIQLTDNGKTLFDDRVVVGTETTQTPIFSKNMTTVVLKPQWFLPDSIKLTALLSGRSIESQGFVVIRNGHVVDSTRVNWSNANLNEYAIYQPSGDDNALGLVKLLFPNKHSVYLHDTPSKYLFNESVRLFSHGCMRVRNPQDLAQQLLTVDRGAAAPDVKKLIRKGPMDNQFTLEAPIPVHVGYFTVWVDDAGQPHFYDDYYGHQKRITLALAGKWDQIDVGKDHLAAIDPSLMKAIKIGSDKSKKKMDDGAMGLTNSFGVSYSRYGDSVGDMIRRSLAE